MPCEDISEFLELTLDGQERLTGFSLSKQTCGAGVGAIAPLEPLVMGRSVEELVDLAFSQLRRARLKDGHRIKALHEFLLDKQLTALRAALGVYLGRSSGAAHEPFALECLQWQTEGARIAGIWKVAAAAESVSPCGGCSCR